MNVSHKIEKPVYTKAKRLMDSEAVAKDKRYKLGVWLHSEHREKLKKATDLNEDFNNRASFH